MMRINCISVKDLPTRVLKAELFEIPRGFQYVLMAVKARRPIEMYREFDTYEYTHQPKFFYTRLGWLAERYLLVAQELARRGVEIESSKIRLTFQGYKNSIPDKWWGYWGPTERDLAFNQEKLEQRLNRSGKRPPRPVMTNVMVAALEAEITAELVELAERRKSEQG